MLGKSLLKVEANRNISQTFKPIYYYNMYYYVLMSLYCIYMETYHELLNKNLKTWVQSSSFKWIVESCILGIWKQEASHSSTNKCHTTVSILITMSFLLQSDRRYSSALCIIILVIPQTDSLFTIMCPQTVIGFSRCKWDSLLTVLLSSSWCILVCTGGTYTCAMNHLLPCPHDTYPHLCLW